MPDQPHPSGSAAGLQGAGETTRDSHPIPEQPAPLRSVPAADPKAGAEAIETHVARRISAFGIAEKGPGTLHLNAMIAGCRVHPRLCWAAGEMLTAEDFDRGLAIVEGHCPEMLHNS